MVGVSGNVPLKRAKDAWEKLYNAKNIHPSLNQNNLTRVMRKVGVNRAGQNVLFTELANMSDQLVYDQSSMFSRSMNINQAEKRYRYPRSISLSCAAQNGIANNNSLSSWQCEGYENAVSYGQ